jgi:hypothetical protein
MVMEERNIGEWFGEFCDVQPKRSFIVEVFGGDVLAYGPLQTA